LSFGSGGVVIGAQSSRVFESCPVLREALLLLNASALAACGGGDTTGPSCCMSLSLPSPQLTVIQGSSSNIPVTLTRTNNYASTVTLSVSGLPAGVTATFNPVSLSGAARTSTLTITAAVDAPIGTAPISTDGIAPDSLDSHAFAALNVITPRVNVSLAGAGVGTVTSSPAGINCGTACNAGFRMARM
jgi:hypothetical protein